MKATDSPSPMPRARLPHARLFASADSSLLPFLAPRAFAVSPVPTTLPQQDAPDSHGRRALRGQLQLAGQRYADIASYAFKQARSYNTAEHARGVEQVDPGTRSQSPQLPPRLRIVRAARRDRTAQTSLRRSNKQSEIWRPTHAPSSQGLKARRTQIAATPWKMLAPAQAQLSRQLRSRRRQRSLKLERRRLDYFLYYRSRRRSKESDLLMHGRYRSLRRRIYNFWRTRKTTISMEVSEAGWERHRLLIRAFAALDFRMFAGVKRKAASIVIKHDSRCAEWAAQIFGRTGPQDSALVWDNWRNFDVETRDLCWRPLLIYLLDTIPSRALLFIQALAYDGSLDTLKKAHIADALGHLARIHSSNAYFAYHGWDRDTKANKSQFVATFYHIFRQALVRPRGLCTQDLFYSIASFAETDDLKRLLDLILDSDTNLEYDTLLHWADAFGEAGQTEYAMSCLGRIKPEFRALNRVRFRWSCASILRKSMKKDRNYHDTPRLVAELVNLGVKMDTLLYNVIMHNAMEAGDYQTAFKVYNSLEGNGLRPDKFTFSILLHGCTVQNNPAQFQEFAAYCARAAAELKDPWLATDYLYYLYVRHKNDEELSVEDAKRLFSAYSQFFDMTSLKPLLDRADFHFTIPNNSTSGTTSFEPTPVALYIMLQALIRFAASISNRRLHSLYQKLKWLVSKGCHPALTRMGHDTVVWNAFLHAFCQKQQFASASYLIKEMTDTGPQPDVYSWNIFLQAFFKNDQVQAAERVYQIMRSRGVDPNQYTYGVMLRGYARAQHVEQIGSIIEHVDEENQLDPGLLQALSRVQRRQRLMLELEGKRASKEKRAREKAETEAEERRRLWSPPSFKSSPTSTSMGIPTSETRKTDTQTLFGQEFGFKSEQTEHQGEETTQEKFRRVFSLSKHEERQRMWREKRARIAQQRKVKKKKFHKKQPSDEYPRC